MLHDPSRCTVVIIYYDGLVVVDAHTGPIITKHARCKGVAIKRVSRTSTIAPVNAEQASRLDAELETLVRNLLEPEGDLWSTTPQTRLGNITLYWDQ